MANDCAIQPLDVSTFPTPDDVSNPGFTDLFNELVGDAATSADGFDTDIEEANALLDSIDNALTDLGGADGGTLDDTFEEILQFDPADAGGHVVDATAAIADAGTNVDQLGNELAAASLPGPGGGGGGGPAGAAPPSNCFAVGFGTVQGFSQVLAQSFTFTNTRSVAVTVKSVTAAPAVNVNVAELSPDLTGRVLQPGEAVTLTVGIIASPGTFSGTFTLNTDAPDPQPCITWSFTAINPVEGGGTQPPTGILTGGGQPPRFGRNA